jgi:hypothetical protein
MDNSIMINDLTDEPRRCQRLPKNSTTDIILFLRSRNNNYCNIVYAQNIVTPFVSIAARERFAQDGRMMTECVSTTNQVE